MKPVNVAVPATIIVSVCILLSTLCSPSQAADVVSMVDKVPTRGSSLYVTNRAPLQPSPLVRLPFGAITPKGWLKRQLELDAQGMVGNLPQVSEFVKDGCAWASPTGQGHHAWEEPVYWLRGYAALGYVLRDEEMIATTRKWVDAMIASRQPDGYFGPVELKTRMEGKPESWPHMLAINALRFYYEYTADKRVIELLNGYFKWLGSLKDEDFHRSGLDNIRSVEQIENIYWLYNRTGDASLLALAKRIHASTADWTNDLPSPHNVDIAECFCEPAVFWQQSGEAKHFKGTQDRYDQVMNEFGQFPGGGFAGDENSRHGFGDPRQGFETCGFVEFMHSFEALTRIEGDPAWADRCEDIAFNSYPAALAPDHKGLHYITCANMVSQDFRNRQMTFTNGWCRTGYSPTADYRCCQHNHGLGWSTYAQELWLATADRGLCASLYAASDVKAKVGNGTEVRIAQSTDYPFSDTITLKLSAPKPVAFPLYLRVPRWCESASVRINGRAIALKSRPLSYVVIKRTWKTGDVVTLRMPMRVQLKTWQKNNNSVSVSYGPIWFSLKIGEQWKEIPRVPGWPGYEVQPTSPWNYGLVIDGNSPEKAFRLITKSGPVSDEPFTPKTVPFEIQAKARRIPEWILGPEKWIAPLQMSPAKSTEPVETVTLIPMGAARLRICSFPTVSPDATNAWVAPKMPLTASFTATTSFGRDPLDAVNDGLEPSNSNDGGVPRFTWWDHKGTSEWLQYDFDKPRTVSSVSVYWFDDTGGGQCRVPASWKLLYKKDGQWKPVALSEGPWKALEGTTADFGVKKDEYNTVRFASITTEGLRMELQLQDTFSAGVLEWKVGE